MVLPEDFDVSTDTVAQAIEKLVSVGYDREAAEYIVERIRSGEPLDI